MTRLRQGFVRQGQQLPSISLAAQFVLESALDYFRTNYTNPTCTIETCAIALSITERRLEQIFHDILGVTPKYCLIRMRIKTALWLKQNNPRLRIKDVYQNSGFNNQSTFAREFMKILHPKRNIRQIHHIKYLLNRPNHLKVICNCPKCNECDQWLYSGI
ncbi:MAG: helix-turn-helix domain-containing protein [bacterium]|nr:helix-turn-helix domain-containing protein [bacterium]